jgi:hypothetical protein
MLSDDGGSPILGYRLYRSNYSEGPYALIGSPQDLSYIDVGVINGQTYWYRVSAVNAIGEGLQTDPISCTPATVPTVPLNLLCLSGRSQAILSWSAPASDGGSAVDYYLVYQDGVALPLHVTGLNQTVAGLTNGRTYSFAVAAHNGAGNGARTSNVTADPATVPGAPRNVTATPRVGLVNLTWQAPDVTGGRWVTHYLVYRNVTGGFEPIADRNGLTHQNDSWFYLQDIDVIAGCNYTYFVVALNDVGAGADSALVTATPQSATKDNTMLYAGVAVVIIAAIVVTALLLRRRKK